MPCGRPVHWQRATVSVMEPKVTATRCSRYIAEQAILFGSSAHGLCHARRLSTAKDATTIRTRALFAMDGRPGTCGLYLALPQ